MSSFDESPRELRIPPQNGPLLRQLVIPALRALPWKKSFVFHAYNRLFCELKRIRKAKTYFGATVECDLGDFIPIMIYHFGVWEPHISAFIQRTLGPGDVFCDVGANIGYDTLLGSSLVGATGSVIAVEPSTKIIERLKRNLQLNRVSNVRLIQAAVAMERGSIALYGGYEGNAGAATTLAQEGRPKEGEVMAITMDDVLTDNERSRLKLIKIDVEGAEAPILSQILDHIDMYNPRMQILVEMAPRESPELDMLFARFAELGFKAHALVNKYDVVGGYLDFTSPIPATPISAPPSVQTDIVFSRAAQGS
jgi:FkbM family methyltransferase